MRSGIGARILALLPAVALIVAGCANSSTSNTAPTPKVVRVLAVAGPETDALIKYAPEFEKATGITASIEQVARPLWGQRKVRELIEGAGLYDVVMVGGGDDNTWVKYKAHVKDLSKLLPADQLIQVNLLDKFKVGDKIVGIPQYYNFPMLFYRKDLFENPAEQAAFKAKYGRDLTPPTSYEDMYQVAQFFNRPPNLYGFFIGGVDWSIYLDDTYFVYGLGANYGDLTTKQLTLNTPEQKQALSWLGKFTALNPPGWQTENFFDGDTLMQNGKIAMYQNWFYIWQTFHDKQPNKIGMAPLIGKGAHLGAFVATIPEAAPSPQAATKFIQWMMGATYQNRGPSNIVRGARKLPTTSPTTAGKVAIRPDALYSVLTRVHREWTKLPLWITENGIALHDYVGPDGRCQDPERIDYFAAHFRAAARAIDHGVPLEAYFVWSLTDNFEWAEGYRLRFGLIHVDYPTQTRLLKRSAHWFARVITANAVPDAVGD